MKNYLSILLFVTLSFNFNAQGPQGFNYQATVRNGSGDLILNQNVNFKFNILQGSQTAVSSYIETHDVQTDDLGQVSLVIGKGTPSNGVFSDLDWSLGNYFLYIELNTGGGYIAMGTTQFYSVPYALYAKEAGYINEIQNTNLLKYDTQIGDNLINPFDLISNKSINKSNGVIQANNLWYASDYISVEEGVTYVVPNLTNYAPYNSEKIFVKAANMTEQTVAANIGNYFLVTIPTGVSYLRVSRGANVDVLALRITVAKFYKDPTHQSFSFDFNKGLFPHLKMPFKGKRVTIVGDSYSDAGRWLYALLSITGLQIRINIGQSGAPMVRFPYNMSQIKTEIEESDLIIIMGGTNDYGIIRSNGNATYPTVLGNVNDHIRDLSTIIANGSTIYSQSIATAIKECALVVDTYNSDARILFVSQPERGVYGNMYGLVPPALNSNGLNLANISNKIEEVCNTFGYDFFNFHQKGWRLSQIDKYSDDNLHPNALGADLLGGMIGKYINETYSYFGIN